MKGIVFSESTVREMPDGYLLSDLHLSAIIALTVSGVQILHAEQAEKGSPRFLFYCRGDKKAIKNCINSVFSGKSTGVEKEMVAFAEKINFLKHLLDLAKTQNK